MRLIKDILLLQDLRRAIDKAISAGGDSLKYVDGLKKARDIVNGQPTAKKIARAPRYEHETVTRHGYDGTIVTIEPVVNVRCAHCGNKFYSIVDDMIVGGAKTNYCSSCGEKVDWGDNA